MNRKFRNQKYFYYLLTIIVLLTALASCSYSYKFTIVPEGTEVKVDGTPVLSPEKYLTKMKTISVTADLEGYTSFQASYENNDFFKPREIAIALEPLQFQVSITIVDEPSQYAVDDTFKGTTPANLTLTWGKHTLVLSRDKYENQTIELDIKKNQDFVFRHQEKDPGLKPVGVFKCGSLPKQVLFSPDNRYIYIALLNDLGYQIFDMETQTLVTAEEERKGYVEELFIPKYDSYLVTQMGTDSIWEYEISGERKLKRRIQSYGRWPKVVDYCDSLDVLAVSNWIGDSVCIIDYKTGNLLHTIPNLVTPRGVVFTHDGKYLVVCSYDGFFIRKYATSTWQQVGEQLYRRSGAMRHVVMAKNDKLCWVSDMYWSEIYEIDMESFTIQNKYKCQAMTNTIDISPDERFLFCSNRGPNNPQSYLLRSPVNGQVTIIDVKNKKVLKPIYGGNQPTGLAVSNDGKYVCFSNFRDENFEIYEIGNLYNE